MGLVVQKKLILAPRHTASDNPEDQKDAAKPVATVSQSLLGAKSMSWFVFIMRVLLV